MPPRDIVAVPQAQELAFLGSCSYLHAAHRRRRDWLLPSEGGVLFNVDARSRRFEFVGPLNLTGGFDVLDSDVRKSLD